MLGVGVAVCGVSPETGFEGQRWARQRALRESRPSPSPSPSPSSSSSSYTGLPKGSPSPLPLLDDAFADTFPSEDAPSPSPEARVADTSPSKGAPSSSPEEQVSKPGWTFDPRSFAANKRSSECPVGQRTATASECLTAVRVAALHQSAGKVRHHLRSVSVSAIDGSVPSGCSYSAVSSVAIFNSHPAGGNGWLPEADYKMWLARGRSVNRSAYTLVCHDGVAKPAGVAKPDRDSRTLADGDDEAAEKGAEKEEAWESVMDQLGKEENEAYKEAEKEREDMTEKETAKEAEKKAERKALAKEATKENRRLANEAAAKIADAEAHNDLTEEKLAEARGNGAPTRAHAARVAKEKARAGDRPHDLDGDSRPPAQNGDGKNGDGKNGDGKNGDGKNVWWLHIPKCGSSFSRSAGMYPTDPNRNGGTHAVLPADADKATLGRVITMFRAPKQRLMSMYEYMKRDVKMIKGKPNFYGAGFSWGWNMVDAHVVRRGIYNNGSVAETLGSFVGCQANAVLGHRCLNRNLTDVTAAKAIARAGQFRFIGLESEWALSVCLFNYAMSGTRYVTQGQLVNLRPTDASSGLSTEYNETDVPDDPIDDELYAWAEMRFEQQLKEHDISEATCPDYTSTPPPGSARLRRAEGLPMQSTDDPDADAEQETDDSYRFYGELD